MFRIRYNKATGEIVEWGENPVITEEEWGIIEEHDGDLAQYLTLVCSVAGGALNIDRDKIGVIKTAKTPSMGFPPTDFYGERRSD